MMRKHKMEAPNFREAGGCAKEFITDDGKTYIILGFPDNSALVLQKTRGTGKASADFQPVKQQKPILRKLGANKAETYAMAWQLLR